MFHDPCCQNKVEKTPVVSRRGRNFLLHNLEESDVVFGTKGNGRNEIFLKVLESHSKQYVQLSKFQKMGLIQKIIRDWKGNFYIMNSKTNSLCLAKEKDHDLSSTDPSSRKLYTSVRRMMNYVNSKIQRQPYHPHRSKCISASTLLSQSLTIDSMGRTPQNPAANTTLIKKETEQKSSKNTILHNAEITISVAQKKLASVMTATNYIRNNHTTLSLPKSTFLKFPCTPTNMNISSPERSVMLVTPEPSPRATVQSYPHVSPILFSKPILSETNPTLIAPSLPLSPLVSAGVVRKNSTKNIDSKHQVAITAHTPRKRMIKKDYYVANNTIGDLEESAILALTSLGSSSTIVSN